MGKMVSVCLVLSLLVAVSLSGCGSVAKSFGGTITINVEKGQKVVTASWKDANLWVLTRAMKPEEKPETLNYVEHSNLGIINGKVILVESK